MAFELDLGPEDGAPLEDRIFWFVLESLFLILFVVELLIRVYWERSAWLRSWWNWLDFFVICIGMLESWILVLLIDGGSQLRMVTLLRIVRLVRLLRVAKLVRAFRPLYVTVLAMREAIRSMLHIMMIMVSGLFLCSIFTTATVGRSDELRELQMGPANGKERFGSIPRSMYSLFELMLLEGWEEVGRPLVMAEPAMSIFIFLFMMFFTFGLLNMIVAIVVEKTLNQAKQMQSYTQGETHAEDIKALLQIEDRFKKGDGALSYVGFEKMLGDRENKIADVLSRYGIPIHDADVLCSILDADLDGAISFEELLTGCSRIHDANDSLAYEVLAMQAAMRDLHRCVKLLCKNLCTDTQSLEKHVNATHALSDSTGSYSVCETGTLGSDILLPTRVAAAPPPRVNDVQPPHLPPLPLNGAGGSLHPPSSLAVMLPLVPGSVVHAEDAMQKAVTDNTEFLNHALVSSDLPRSSSCTSSQGFKVGKFSDQADFKVDTSSQIADVGLLKDMEVDATANAALFDMMCRLELESRARVADQVQLIARLDASIAKQEEVVRRLTHVDDFSMGTGR
eukprot:CAMPEP_0169246454 /NCGR_PEP_ID=MMETSP1016-20121227/34743_1 /TAXON_ID=342587 /ORGANISM="Karlodinium micrum, Strain CCMP2283" /LENGTH=564 /DNA_ID=CAMNT_0009327035 /DNA_START=131 /DNA_END=1825 /DNA_ORIENTATION=+